MNQFKVLVARYDVNKLSVARLWSKFYVRKVETTISKLSPCQERQVHSMSQFKVLVTRDDVNNLAVKRLQSKYDVECHTAFESFTQEDFIKAVRGKHAILFKYALRVDKEVLDAAGPQLKVIAALTIGYDKIDVEECKKRSIIVCNARSPELASAVAEMTVWLMVTAGRRLIEAYHTIERGEWKIMGDFNLCGRGLLNAVVGIVGMGSIGFEVLKRVLPFGVSQVLYCNRHHPNSEAEKLGAQFLPFEELLEKSNFVVVACSLNPQSKGLFDAKAFSLMKKTAIFVNVGRGEIVDQDALYDALLNHRIKGAALDVMYPEPLPKDHKLLSLPNIVLTPHICGIEQSSLEAVGEIAVRNIEAVLEGKDPITPV